MPFLILYIIPHKNALKNTLFIPIFEMRKLSRDSITCPRSHRQKNYSKYWNPGILALEPELTATEFTAEPLRERAAHRKDVTT